MTFSHPLLKAITGSVLGFGIAAAAQARSGSSTMASRITEF